MKEILAVFFSVLCGVFLMFALSSCGECKEHTYENGICTICGAEEQEPGAEEQELGTEGLLYILSEDKASCIVAGIESLTENRIRIPEKHNGLPVVGIGSYAFCNRTALAEVTIPRGVTDIGEGVFAGCTALESITVEEGNAAYRCEGNCLIETEAKLLVAGCKNSVIPADGSVTGIGDSAFSGCTGLANPVIPGCVTNIGKQAFKGCSALTSITIPASVESIGTRAFEGCTRLAAVDITDLAGWCAIEFDDSFANPLTLAHNLYLNGAPVEDLVIPEGVTGIGVFAFSGSTELTSVTVPKSVEKIGYGAFEGCTGLTGMTIPFVGEEKNGTSNHTYLGFIFGAHASHRNSDAVPASLKTIVMTDCAGIGEYAFDGCAGIASITIPEGVINIGSFSFSGCTGLAGVTIPGSVETIGKGAFSDCTGFTNVMIPERVTSIGDRAFRGCTSLSDITIPGSVEEIGYGAFENCSSLVSVVIPAGVISIGGGVFKGCTGLENVTLPFLGGESGGTRHEANLSFVFGSRGESDIPASLRTVVLTNITCIGAKAFAGCTGLTIMLPASVTKIDYRAFFDCEDITVCYAGSEQEWSARFGDVDLGSNGKVVYNAEQSTAG